MPDDTTDDATSEEIEQNDETQETESQDTTEDETSLGDAGKKALDAMKLKWKNAEKSERALKAELAKRDADAALKDKPAEEQALEAARAEARAEERAKSDKRTISSELKLAAKGKLADVSDALLNINLDDFTVDEDGDVDSDALDEAITALLKKKPHLAAGTQPRFEGGGDGGARPTPKPKESIDDALVAAIAARNFPLVATLRQQKAAEKS